MRIKLFTIPNFITLANLLCGVLAIWVLFDSQDYKLAFWLIILAAVFDFCDGLAARILSQQSLIGVQLDSLADLISFGLTPTFALFMLTSGASSAINCSVIENFLPFITFIIVAFSALRLAKFNIDKTQESNFVGLPTPANAILCMSVGLLHQIYGLNINGEWLAILAVVMSVLMVAPLNMFSLKFKGLDWSKNMLRYIFLGVAIVELCLFRLYAIPLVIASYILMSIAVDLYKPIGKA